MASATLNVSVYWTKRAIRPSSSSIRCATLRPHGPAGAPVHPLGTIFWYRPDGELSPEQLAGLFERIYLDGVVQTKSLAASPERRAEVGTGREANRHHAEG